MKLLLILSGVLIIQGRVINKRDAEEDNNTEETKQCDGVIINNIYHEKEILKEDIDRPYLLAVDYSTNSLYFSYNVNPDTDIFTTARININSKEFANIDGVNNGFAQTVDQNKHVIYIGGSDGLYKYEHGADKAELIGERDTNIWTVYFKDILYFSVYPSQFFYTFVDGYSSRFKDLEDTKVYNFVVDNEDDIFFNNASGLFSQKKGSKDATKYEGFPLYDVRALTTDINGNVYVCHKDAISLVNKSTRSLEKVFDVSDAFGLAFDNDNNFIYSDATSVIRLKPNNEKSCD